MQDEDENELSKPVFWSGRQWAVTSYGLEVVGKPYHYCIPKAELCLLAFDNSGLLQWPEHMFRKRWCDTYDFGRAFCEAVTVHALEKRLPSDWNSLLLTSIEKSNAVWAYDGRIRKYLPGNEWSTADLAAAVNRVAQEELH